jgi:hypothetical protein
MTLDFLQQQGMAEKGTLVVIGLLHLAAGDVIISWKTAALLCRANFKLFRCPICNRLMSSKTKSKTIWKQEMEFRAALDESSIEKLS